MKLFINIRLFVFIKASVSRPHSWPWQVLLKILNSRGISECGGSLISKEWIRKNLFFIRSLIYNEFLLILFNLFLVTAAHCVDRFSKNNYSQKTRRKFLLKTVFFLNNTKCKQCRGIFGCSQFRERSRELD